MFIVKKKKKISSKYIIGKKCENYEFISSHLSYRLNKRVDCNLQTWLATSLSEPKFYTLKRCGSQQDTTPLYFPRTHGNS